ncbi:MAG: tyrosine-type recombinase/integrase [Bdellovibrionales bacterium]|nr:tyrosine-type recombinase/integrase [Bdellovibrionales bacterium]
MLRDFCKLHGLLSIKFHTLRACFSTQLLRQGVEAAKVMKICGWKDLKTMQRYIRLGMAKQAHNRHTKVNYLDFLNGTGVVATPPISEAVRGD